jgi:hypothetical protein
LPYPDAKVAAVLCGGGLCIYVTNPAVDAAMMKSFILSHVGPNVRKRLPESACLVLGKTLMWLLLLDWAQVCGGDLDVDVLALLHSSRSTSISVGLLV